MASMVDDATGGGVTRSPSVVLSAVSGTMISAITIAAGAPSTEAITKCADASGMCGASTTE